MSFFSPEKTNIFSNVIFATIVLHGVKMVHAGKGCINDNKMGARWQICEGQAAALWLPGAARLPLLEEGK